MNSSEKSLKSHNMKWLCALIALDVVLLLTLAFPSALDTATSTRMLVARLGVATLLPVVVLLLSALVSPNAKAVLVYWRLKDTLPGHRAFTTHAAADTRIDLGALRNNVGVFPEDPRDQNSLWYKLYTKVASETTVQESHKSYLLFRDIAVVSLLIAAAAPIAWLLVGASAAAATTAVALMGGQYVLAAIAARNSGVRFVTNVLAVHSTKRVIRATPSQTMAKKQA